jgi:hypothetical protein
LIGHDQAEMIHRMLLERKQGKKYINSSGLLQFLSRETGLSIADVKHFLGQLQSEGKIGGGVNSKGELFGRIEVFGELPPRELSDVEKEWKQALSEEGLSDDSENLMGCAEAVRGLHYEDMKSLINGIKKLRQEAHSLLLQDPYVVSAKYLLSSAKALDKIGPAFSLSPSLFTGRSAYVVTAGPLEPECILFIENQAPFEMFCSSEAVSSAMGVMTFGYGLSWSGITTSIGARSIVQLVRSGTPPELSRMLHRVPCFFWGDLDREGLNIFLQLKAKISHIKLSALYFPMIDMLRNKSLSHPYCQLADKANQKHLSSENLLISKLTELCSERAVDQEAVGISDFLCLYNKELQF